MGHSGGTFTLQNRTGQAIPVYCGPTPGFLSGPPHDFTVSSALFLNASLSLSLSTPHTHIHLCSLFLFFSFSPGNYACLLANLLGLVHGFTGSLVSELAAWVGSLVGWWVSCWVGLSVPWWAIWLAGWVCWLVGGQVG